MNSWERLGLAPTNDKRAIKSAYAQKLKEGNIQSDPEAFQALREALDDALQMAESHSPTQRESAIESTDSQTQMPEGAEVANFDKKEVIIQTHQPDAEFEATKNPSALSTEPEYHREYQNFFERLQYYISRHGDDEGQWQVIYHDTLLDESSTRNQLAPEVFRLVAEAYQAGTRVSPAIIRQLDQIFAWKNMELELSERFPPEYFDFLIEQDKSKQVAEPTAKGSTSMTIAAIIGFNILVFLLCLQLVS